WTNLHGGFFVIFLVLACYIGGHLLNALIESDPLRRREYVSKALPWIKTFAVCFAVTFINPYGWQLHHHIVTYIADPYLLQHIGEFQGVDFHSPAVVYFEPLIIAALGASFWAIRQRRFAEAFLALGWTHLALIAVRNLPLFCIACAPLIAEGIVTVIRGASTAPLRERFSKVAVWFREASSGVDATDRIGRTYL